VLHQRPGNSARVGQASRLSPFLFLVGDRLEALSYRGIGVGIDRLCMMPLGQQSIRDLILFPQLKPK
jgi:aspartyl-tRNA synthetase